MKILLGPAGSPAKSSMEGLKAVHDMGLGAMEVAFTHGVHMGIDTAKSIAEENEKYNISLSTHAPYYINLVSDDAKKIKASRQRILESCERAHHMGAKKVIFHAAYYGSLGKERVYTLVKEEISTMLDEIKENEWNVNLLPETMGRLAQFGDLEELIAMVKEARCSICIDPAHLYARYNGKIDFSDVFDKLARLKRKEFHFHFSGINYGERGEKNHLVLGAGGPSFDDFAKELLKRKIDSTIISESPITWKDSLKMKKTLEKMGHVFTN
jgi:deoxyribonuclease IV